MSHQETRPCQFCLSPMPTAATVCPHCGRRRYDPFLRFLAVLGFLVLVGVICLVVLL